MIEDLEKQVRELKDEKKSLLVIRVEQEKEEELRKKAIILNEEIEKLKTETSKKTITELSNELKNNKKKDMVNNLKDNIKEWGRQLQRFANKQG